MARTIILVRHGKAKKAQLGTDDIDRPLVPGAAEALAPTFRHAVAQLHGARQAHLWVSPALRAKQTSAALAPALVGNGIQIVETRNLPCLFEQDQATFLDELAATPDDACVAAVGHIPFMDELLTRLCDCQIDFAPGSIAAVKLDGDPRDPSISGTLLWYRPRPQAVLAREAPRDRGTGPSSLPSGDKRHVPLSPPGPPLAPPAARRGRDERVDRANRPAPAGTPRPNPAQTQREHQEKPRAQEPPATCAALRLIAAILSEPASERVPPTHERHQ